MIERLRGAGGYATRVWWGEGVRGHREDSWRACYSTFRGLGGRVVSEHYPPPRYPLLQRKSRPCCSRPRCASTLAPTNTLLTHASLLREKPAASTRSGDASLTSRRCVVSKTYERVWVEAFGGGAWVLFPVQPCPVLESAGRVLRRVLYGPDYQGQSSTRQGRGVWHAFRGPGT